MLALLKRCLSAVFVGFHFSSKHQVYFNSNWSQIKKVNEHFFVTGKFCIYLSSHQKSYKKSCSKNICNIHRKTPALWLLFNSVAALKVCNFFKKRVQHYCFPVNIAKFLRTPTLENTSEHLLIYLYNFL